MLVSHRHKFIYTKTYKTGGTSIESYFERFCVPEGEYSPTRTAPERISAAGIVGQRGSSVDSKPTFWNHMPAFEIKQEIGEQCWDSYFKFCAIRNPFERVVSLFFFQDRSASIDDDPLSSKTQERFEHFVHNLPGIAVDRDKFTINGNFCLDDVIRYERLEDDVMRICQKLQLPWEKSWLPNLKSGIRPAGTEARKLFTDSTRNMIEATFKYELDQFGYEFD